MKILVYSDVHGNLPAFERMLKFEQDAEMYISLGDLVNYGPWSDECVQLSLSLPNSVNIMGNHERAFLDGLYSGSNKLVKSFFSVTYPGFHNFSFIERFLNQYSFFGFNFSHTINNSYIFPDSEVKLDSNYFVGHSHYQFFIENNSYVLYNPGSVGQNRRDIGKINYALFFTENKEVEFKSLAYDPMLLISEMENRNYPKECINYYRGKLFL